MKCDQTGYNNIATYRVFWPGNQPLVVCKEHVLNAHRIANSLGMYIHIEEIPNGDTGENERRKNEHENSSG